MTITQTIDIPADRCVTLNIPREVPEGRTIVTFTPAPQAPLHPCPICAQKIDPETGNPHWGPKTVAALEASIEEANAMKRGEIPAKRFSSLDEMWEDLMRDDDEEDDI